MRVVHCAYETTLDAVEFRSTLIELQTSVQGPQEFSIGATFRAAMLRSNDFLLHNPPSILNAIWSKRRIHSNWLLHHDVIIDDTIWYIYSHGDAIAFSVIVKLCKSRVRLNPLKTCYENHEINRTRSAYTHTIKAARTYVAQRRHRPSPWQPEGILYNMSWAIFCMLLQ